MLAIQHLETCDSTIAFPLLQEILLDPTPEVRVQAVNSLAKFQDPVVSPLLKKYLKDPDPKVRIAALRSIWREQGR
jgi:HEAT repeat protein